MPPLIATFALEGRRRQFFSVALFFNSRNTLPSPKASRAWVPQGFSPHLSLVQNAPQLFLRASPYLTRSQENAAGFDLTKAEAAFPEYMARVKPNKVKRKSKGKWICLLIMQMPSSPRLAPTSVLFFCLRLHKINTQVISEVKPVQGAERGNACPYNPRVKFLLIFEVLPSLGLSVTRD